MRHAAWLSLLLSTAAFAQSAESITNKYVTAFAAGRFSEAAALIYCSDDLTDAEVASERKGLEKELAFVQHEFGRVTAYKAATSSLYVAVTLGCAPHSFLKANPPEKTEIFDVTYADSSKGYIVLTFITRDRRLMPIMASHGIPQNQPGATERIRRVYSGLLRL